MPETSKTQNAQPWYDVDNGVLDRRVFTDEQIYQQELERIFCRGWNFMCHETQIPDAGNFFMNYIGKDEVIVVRDRKDAVQVLINSCPHRGNTVCRAELGSTNSFFCSYHGWNFDLDGSLIAVPGEDNFYRNDIDKTDWGLSSAARVESYRGFVFATLDHDAPPLEEFLGWVGKLSIDTVASLNIDFLDGVVKNRLKCNWKLAVDNLYDWYHIKVSHGSAIKVGLVPEEALAPMSQMVLLGEYGHGVGGPGISEEEQAEFDARMASGEGEPQWYDREAMLRSGPGVREQLGPVGSRAFGHPNIFPNLWFAVTGQICLRIPRGPLETEIWWFTYMPRDIPEEERQFRMMQANHVFGPAGIAEQDDGENWSHSTRGAAGTFSKTLPLNYRMGLGHDELKVDPTGQSAIECVVSEHGQRWTYRSWQEWMMAENWSELMATHSPVPTGEV